MAIIIHKISKSYWIEISQEDLSIKRFLKIDDESILENWNNKILKGREIASKLNINCILNKSYHVVLNEHTLFINKIGNIHFYNASNVSSQINNICDSLKIFNKETLINKIFINEKCSIEQAVEEIKK